MKKITVEHAAWGLTQKVEEVSSPNDVVDNTPSVMASTGLTELLLEVADNTSYIKRQGFIDKNTINFNDYNTSKFVSTGEFIDVKSVAEKLGIKGPNVINKSLDDTYGANSLFRCDCGNTKKFVVIRKVLELKAVGIQCEVCNKEYWFIPKYICEELEKFQRQVYNNSLLDVESKMVMEQDFVDRVQRFPVGGQYVIFEKRGRNND